MSDLAEWLRAFVRAAQSGAHDNEAERDRVLAIGYSSVTGSPEIRAKLIWADLIEAADTLDARDREIAELRAKLKAARQDAQEDARNAATEATWKERLGDDYGSY